MSVLQNLIALRTRKVFGNFEERVPAEVNQERKTVNNSLLLYYSVGSTLKRPRKLRKISANSKRRAVGGILVPR